jgi:hypothetical protein
MLEYLQTNLKLKLSPDLNPGVLTSSWLLRNAQSTLCRSDSTRYDRILLAG